MNFTKTILSGLRVWINSNFISHNKQALSDTQKEQVQENIGIVNATDDEIIDLILEMDMLPAVLDENDNIMTDETGAILLI